MQRYSQNTDIILECSYCCGALKSCRHVGKGELLPMENVERLLIHTSMPVSTAEREGERKVGINPVR